MKKKSLLGMFFGSVALLLILLSAAGVEAATREERGLEELTYVPGEILVRWKDWADGFSIQRAHSRRGAKVVSVFYATHRRERTIQQVCLREGQAVEEALREYRRNPLVAHAQPNYLFRLQTIPDDTRFAELWGLHNTGQTVEGVTGTYDADIDAPEAWGITTGSAAIIIAVTDTGVMYNHPELTGNMWINPGEIAGDGIDNDGNNFTDDIHGWDFFDNDSSPLDFHGHGTHVAGTIAAAGNNAEGVAGVMWNAQIMALQIFDKDGWAAPLSDIVRAINYAAAEGAHIINASWGGGGGTDAPGDILRDAIEAAGDAGVLFVAAAGNWGTCNDTIPMFPASYTLPNIISVAATNQHDDLAWFSNFGATSVDVAAPGVNILSTIPIPAYGPPVTLYDSAGFDADTAGTLPAGWVAKGPNNTWAVTATHSLSAPHSLADSPGADYLNNLLSPETLVHLATPITYEKDHRFRLTFDIRYDITFGDWFDIMVSRDGGATWTFEDWLFGSSGGDFVPHTFDFTSIVRHYGSIHLGFGMWTDEAVTGEGVYIDNLLITKAPIIGYEPAYDFAMGTSMSAPHVAGLAGLLLSRSPHLTVGQLKELIIVGVDPKPGLAGKMVSGGRINAHTSLTLPALSVTPDPSLDFGNVAIGESRDLDFTVTNTGRGTLTGSASLPAGPFSIVSGSPFSLIADASAPVTVRFSPTAVGLASEMVPFTSNGGHLNRAVSGVGTAPVLKGDINNDGEVSIPDVILCLRMTIDLPVIIEGETHYPPYPQWLIERADMDGNGEVGIPDVILILRRTIEP